MTREKDGVLFYIFLYPVYPFAFENLLALALESLAIDDRERPL